MEAQKFNSITHGLLSKSEMFNQILKDLKSNKDEEVVLTVGTDSQSHGKMETVTVVSLHRIGKGVKFFYSTECIEKVRSIREKIYSETQKSLNLSKELTEFLYDNQMDFKIAIQ